MASNGTVGEKIEAMMALRGITQGVLELRAGIKQQTISSIITKDRSPRLDTAIALADALDVSLDWLAGRDRKYQPPLDPEETALLQAFEKLGDDLRRAILSMVTQLAESSKKASLQ